MGRKEPLGRLVTAENSKILQEGLGEVQEMIDICDFAVGLSRQLYGLTIASERPGHRMMEIRHPLGPIGVISVFNFPVVVWSWNFALAIVWGNPVVWNPSEKTPLTALAYQALFDSVTERFGEAPRGLSEVVVGDRDIGERLVADDRLRLISATGSTAMGCQVDPRVAARLGRSLLELGGNNGMTVAPSANLDFAVRTILFASVGIAGQRCTTLRRLIAHEDVADDLLGRLKTAYSSIAVGDPFAPETLVGPLIDEGAYAGMRAVLDRVRGEGGTVYGGERVLEEQCADAYYVTPAIVEMPEQTATVCEETFAPILYAMRYREFDEALRLHNGVSQGLSSSIFTNDVREAEAFVSAEVSDCGISNVNIGPSGAEIGGEKETGGGRESRSDAWKAYMRRATNTVNYSGELPLAQGIKFGDD